MPDIALGAANAQFAAPTVAAAAEYFRIGFQLRPVRQVRAGTLAFQVVDVARL